MATSSHPALWKRLIARWHYLWGLSLCLVGHQLVDRSFYTAGIAAFDRALLLWPAFAMACYRRGLIRGRELSEYAAAIHDLDAATTLRPEWPDPYLQRGLFHRFQQHSAAALADLRRYVELAPPGFWRDEAERQIAQILLDGTTE